ncbi:GGDEF domain-containing protein [Photobacterium kishitanii]|uniref:GGDEF domain-containing protein n=1 Tax=Photobacterium kishitanii TaxID=318456 RepID=UPI0004331FDC|nr:GGDEF domain-containing protein [Photobacterium kishitanii]CEO42093.1 Diguanylate cyclase [Photobacterium kishitanii]
MIKNLIFLYLISFLITSGFLTIKIEKLKNEIEQSFRYLSDSIYRYQINTINSKVIYGTKEIENILYLTKVKNDETVKDISENFSNFILDSRRNEIVSGNIWTVANIYPKYMFVEPYRKAYERIHEHTDTDNERSYFDYLVGLENIEVNLEKSNLSIYETMKVYGPYTESDTNEELITIYYPLYVNRKIQSILLLDIKYGFFDEFIINFNKRNFSVIKKEDDINISQMIFDIIAKNNYNDKIHIPVEIEKKYFLLYSIFVFLFFCGWYYLITFLFKFVTESKKDKLTGLYRKDYLNEKNLINCIIVIDIDFFKKVNDTYGHQVGDLVIAEVSNRIRNTIRKTDVGVRWGGEEFVLLLDGVMNISDLNVKLEKLLKIISDKKIEDINVTISIGAFLSSNSIMLSEAFKYADDALYQSKMAGRNQYTIFTDEKLK